MIHRTGFWAMGGYARFVWPSIGFAVAVLVWNLWSARRHHARALLRARRTAAMARSEKS
ncbi:MAG TPA: heme exporter protein CcmD [Steroidobacteraceae bacterium]|nr:heme exporter protein CcmD [Steroidobacteraceae bacterium]